MTTTIDKAMCGKLAEEITAALNTIAARHGLAVEVRGGTFTSSSFKPRVEFLVPGDLGDNRKDEDAWRKYAALYDCDPAWLGKTFVHNRMEFKVVGLAPSRSKNCVKIVRLSDGSNRICPPSMLKGALFY